jgi:hypothetical protein
MCTTTIAVVAVTLLATATAQTTEKVFMPNIYAENLAWDASVIGACADSTTYALRCTGSPVMPTVAKSIGAVYTSQVAAYCDGPVSDPVVCEALRH